MLFQDRKVYGRYIAVLAGVHSAHERMFQEGAVGFIGGMNAQKYIGITKLQKQPPQEIYRIF